MAVGVTSVRLGPELEAAIDREATHARRSRSEMLRFLVEEALAMRREGQVKCLTPEHAYVERFDGAVPDLWQGFRVTRDAWNDDLTERIIYEWV